MECLFIQYIAPQHRQYLSYEGIGHGTPFDREKQYKKYQVKKAVEHVYNHRISKISNADEHSLIFKEAKAVKKIKTQYFSRRFTCRCDIICIFPLLKVRNRPHG